MREADIASHTFAAPVAPWLAARAAGAPLQFRDLVADGKRKLQQSGCLLVEGAGGLLVPLAEGKRMADLAAELSLPLLIIARTGLGTVNHTLLTAAYARQAGLEVLGVILNDSQSGDYDLSRQPAAMQMVKDNAHMIEQFGDVPVLEEGLAVLEADDDELLSIMSAAFKYPLLEKDTLVAGARKAMELKVGTYCIVASGRGPTGKEVDQVIAAVKEIKTTMPMKICACLGILSDEQAGRLKEAGVDRYNHNLNTSAGNFNKITTTHTYDDRVATVEKAKASGMSPCSGCIVGMGETNQEIVEIAYALRELDADSIPVNFLNSIKGTPLENNKELNPRKCLKVLALMRFINPTKEIRASGGREVNLRSMQVLCLYAANSLFVGDYLTTEGQEASQDHKMIEDMGFEIELCAL
ncbi:unnamed protein product [Aphanomyces euteiches]